MPTLNWIGKSAVINHHQEVPFHLLKEEPSLSVGDPDSGNLLVEGDNLLALKALLPYYAGQVKCVYIDPPYNTGNENWVYNDNVNSPEIKKWLGKVVGGEAEDLSRHDKWLCMMYPRMVLIHKFLRDDGAIFISIDENEYAALRLLMNEIFGEQNFIETITWNKRIPKNDAGVGNVHEYVLIYRKSPNWNYELTMRKDGLEDVYVFLDSLRVTKTPIPEAEKRLKKFYKERGFDRGVTLYNSLTENYRAWGKINMSWPNANTFGPRYDVLHPITGKPCKVPERGWRWKEETLQNNLKNGPRINLHDGSVILGRIWFDKNGTTQPSSVIYLDEVDRILLRSVISLKSDGGMELEEIFGEKAKFAYPKPVSLIQTLLDSLKMQEGDIVFDPFAGSGTTAHAVFKLNEKDAVKRRVVLVEMESKVGREVTRERLRRIVIESKEEKTINVGFQYCLLGAACFSEAGRINPEVKFTDLARHVYFVETGVAVSKRLKADSPLVGVNNDLAVYLLYNGILKDKAPDGGNVLTRGILDSLPKHDGPKVIYGTACRLSRTFLKSRNVIFKQIPYEIRVK